MTTAAMVPVPTGGVLIASANSHLCEQVLRTLGPRPGQVHVASGGAEAFAKLDGGNWQMLVLDRQLPDLNAEELVELTNRLYPGIEVVLVDSRAERGFQEAERGFQEKEAFSRARTAGNLPAVVSVLPLVKQSCENRLENKDAPLAGMIGNTEPMRRLYRMVRLVAGRNTTVLITGPSGSGKELVARAIHHLSTRASGSFSVLNCAAIPETLIESELFGYARGAFTGAAQTYAGRILAAQGGTLFLDEIGELPLNAQSKLLRFLEQKEIQRLGSAETCKVDVRVVAATNRNLAELVERKQFRDDLYFRLCAFPIELASLAERGADISLLTTHFLDRLSGRQLRLDPRALHLLEAYAWPGNVRELQQVLERAAILAEDGPTILAEHIVFSFEQSAKIPGKIAC
jgi:DNA-binding NtrC family response regulator